MTDQNIRIDYKKLNSFIKDYARMMKRGWLFLIIADEYGLGEQITFNISASCLEEELSAQGTVVYIGENEKGNNGVGINFSFSSKSKEYLSKALPALINQKYGSIWGEKICTFIGEA
jgi:Tfp pilus assembly protein PilZ